MKVEVSVYRDGFQSSYDFDECFKRISGHTWQYVDYGNIEPLEIQELIHINRNNSKAVLAACLDTEIEWFESYCVDDMIGEIFSEGWEIPDLIAELDRSNVKYSLKYDSYETRGYSQGDYATVIVPHIAVKGGKIDRAGMQKHIDNLFWDQPTGGTVLVDSQHEFHVFEMLDDLYEWDIDKVKDQIIAYIDRRYSNVPAEQAIHDALVEALSEITELEYIG